MPVSDLQAGPRPFTLMGERIVVWQDGDGNLSALRDRCCHRTAQLSRGFYEGGALVCGYHGWTYDRTGKCIRIPQLEREAPPPGASVPAYRASARYGHAWVCLSDEPLADIPDIPEASDPGFRIIPQFYEVWNCAGLRVMENSFDNAHFSFVHRGTFGDQAQPQPASVEIRQMPYGFRMLTEVPIVNPPSQQKLLKIQAERTTRSIDACWWMPFCRTLKISYPNGLVQNIFTAATPIDDRTSLLCQFSLRNDTEADARSADITAFDREVITEDKLILETTDYDVPVEEDPGAERNMASDKPGILMRRMLRELFERHGEREVRNPRQPAQAAGSSPPLSPRS